MRVQGRVYPILAMEWVEGQTLDAYVGNNLGNPAAIWALAQRFVNMASELRHNSIAHGDLQHANILVCNGALRLVDYDGMYVPGLYGMASHEIGHRNYQRPLRTDQDFGPEMDRFSVWVIYLSLVALCVVPRLWKDLGGGEDRLLFGEGDFRDPSNSKVFRTLSQIPHDGLRRLTSSFQACLNSDQASIPLLDETRMLPKMPASPLPVTYPDWVSDHVTFPPSPMAPVAWDTRSFGSSWIRDHLAPAPLVRLQASYVVERVLLAVLALMSIVFVVVSYVTSSSVISFAFAPATVLAGAILLLPLFAVAYRCLPEVQAKRAHLSALRGLVRDKKKLTSQIERLNAETDKLNRSEDVDISAIRGKKAKADREEAAEMASALSAFQTQYVHDQLRRHSVFQATISGIGAEMKRRLLSASVITADDIDWRVNSIYGIGPARASALLAWRQLLESQIRLSVPRSLPSSHVSGIRLKYQSQRQYLDQEELKTRTKYQDQRHDLGLQEIEKRRFLSERDNKIAMTRHEVDAYRQITFVNYLRNVVSG
ncbi:MAG: hypothetical protein M1305_08010 [Candidatus Marsarchaeota archaeon]|nr:hypothetical protein [Candidatus Marsarchaeota archaeon]